MSKPEFIDTKGLTTAEVVGRMFRNVIDQGGRCANEHNDCVYLSDDKSRRCAVGWLLERDAVLSTGGTVSDILEGGYTLGRNYDFIRDNEALLNELQTFHDNEGIVGSYQHIINIAPTLNRLPELLEWIEFNGNEDELELLEDNDAELKM